MQSCLQMMDILEKLRNAGHFDYQTIKRFDHSLNKQQNEWETEVSMAQPLSL